MRGHDVSAKRVCAVTRYRVEHHCDGSAWYDVSYPSPLPLSQGRGGKQVL